MDDDIKGLLELAAKAVRAAGTGIIYTDAGLQIFERHASDGKTECYRVWRPHDDDGDSRRLEVLLRFQVTQTAMGVRVENLKTGYEVFRLASADRLAATRLAVLMAAAAVGRQGYVTDQAGL